MSTTTIVLWVVGAPFILLGFYIFWLMFKELANEYGWFVVIIGIIIAFIFASGGRDNRSNDEPIGEDRFGRPMYKLSCDSLLTKQLPY